MKRLPVIQPLSSALRPDGKRQWIMPADVRGRFALTRRIVFAILIALWMTLPVMRIAGAPLVLLEVGARRFHLFGYSFNAQDTYLLLFIATGVAFTIAAMTAMWGRIWCGYACPQTVFLEGLYRPIERWIEGSREERMKRQHHRMAAVGALKKVVKHALFVLLSSAIAFVFVGLFVPIRDILSSVPRQPEIAVWWGTVTALLYANFAFFREQLCLVICPYGRFQASLVDDDTLTIGYDLKRGEPRGRVPGHGDCVDCRRCVVVCPTGIDIRNGAQLDCIGCAACVDACDEIMEKLARPSGLVRYDSMNGLTGVPKRFLRPRLALYGVLMSAGLAATVYAFSRRKPFNVDVVRPPGVPWVVEDGLVRNTFSVQIANKENRSVRFIVAARGDGLTVLPASAALDAPPFGVVRALVVATGTRSSLLQVDVATRDATVSANASFLAPSEAR
jgi:cytochrome c oxidase accessory protein FixG